MGNIVVIPIPHILKGFPNKEIVSMYQRETGVLIPNIIYRRGITYADRFGLGNEPVNVLNERRDMLEQCR